MSASAAWKNTNTLEMRWQFYETPHHATVTCKFTPGGYGMELSLVDSMAKMSGKGPTLVVQAKAAV